MFGHNHTVQLFVVHINPVHHHESYWTADRSLAGYPIQLDGSVCNVDNPSPGEIQKNLTNVAFFHCWRQVIQQSTELFGLYEAAASAQAAMATKIRKSYSKHCNCIQREFQKYVLHRFTVPEELDKLHYNLSFFYTWMSRVKFPQMISVTGLGVMRHNFKDHASKGTIKKAWNNKNVC